MKTIQVWHDFTCPWCAIGLHNLHVALTQLGHPKGAVAFEPYLLSPDTPPEGQDLRKHLGEKYGVAQVDSMFDRVKSVGAGYGVELRYDLIRIAPQTIPAHALVASVATELRWGLVEAIHAAYFQRGENIGTEAVLTACAAVAGIDAALVAAAFAPAAAATIRAQAAGTRQLGIQGVPHFKIGGRALHGAQDPEALVAALTA